MQSLDFILRTENNWLFMWNGRNLGCSSHIFVIVNGGNIEHNKRWVLDIRKASLKKLKNI